MKNKWKWLTIALIFALSLTGCDIGMSGGGSKEKESKGDPDLSGKITISALNGLTTDKELVAVYTGSEDVSYQWKRGGTAIDHAPAVNKHTPAEAGKYTVTVSAKGYKSKTSASVTVTGVHIPSHRVDFDSNGGTDVNYEMVTEGGHAGRPANPTKTGYDCIFDGWYKEGLTEKWEFDSDTVSGIITLYAKWSEYNIGDTGPGGGKIFFKNKTTYPTGFTHYTNAAGNESTTCYYLEAAPAEWYPSTAPNDPNLMWAPSTSPAYTTNMTGAKGQAIGMGRMNTLEILRVAGSPAGTNAPAANACNIYSSNSLTGWFLPSMDELDELYKLYNANGKGSYAGLSNSIYWASSQFADPDYRAWSKHFNIAGVPTTYKNGTYSVRAVRAF
ncbi:MAG: InlB B-repeat-containing protein [Treponema sp.]|jgi:uncharacterized repeat protein (TIGR02543 family)|nr:InlB B-repeat-containing protein [Treponema sp.]